MPEITLGNLTFNLSDRPTRCGIHGYPLTDGRCFRCDELAEVAAAGRRYAAQVEADYLAGEIAGGYTYDHQRDTVHSFMLAGGGPTVYARFVVRGSDIVHAYIEYASAGVSALALIPENRAADLLAVLRADAEAQR